MKIKLICAADKNFGIGKDGNLPWPVMKTDMKYFKTTTIGNGNNGVLMGSGTWLSIPAFHRPLMSRTNIVMSKKPTPDYPLTIDNWDSVKNFNSLEELWIIGGEDIYKQALEKLDVCEIRLIQRNDCFSCDKYFPKDYLKDFTIKNKTCIKENDLEINFISYIKNIS